MANFLGIEIGGTKLQLLLVDDRLNEIKSFKSKIERSSGAAGIRFAIEKVLGEIRHHQLRAVGVGFGGPINKTTGKIFTSYHIDGWTDFSIKQWLQEKSGVPVFVDNDANVAALGEALYGAGRKHRISLYITLGSGVGSGLVIDQKIFHGAEPAEAEFGHIRLNKSGLTVQDACSGWAVNKKIRQAIGKKPETLLNALTKSHEGNESAALREAIQLGDQTAIEIFENTIDDLTFAISHAVHLFNPNTIIIGGGLSLMGEILRENIESKLKRYLMDAMPPPLIQLSALKEKAVPMGAIGLAINATQSL